MCLADGVRTTAERFVDTNGVRLRVVEAGERGAPLIVLAHGFPELAYSWRHQIPVLADAGYHVLAPDQRGYGGSSRPDAVEDYDIHALTGDIVGLLDSEVGGGAEQAVFIGHDWGAMLVWHTALLHPDRVAAVAGLSVPPIPRARSRPTQRWREKFGDDFYMLRFQQPGVAEADMEADVAVTMRGMFAGLIAGDAPLPDWISSEEFDHYVDEFSRTGFTGALNWYRNYDRNWASTPELAGAQTAVPALFVGGTEDPVGPTMNPARAREVVAGPYTERWIDGAGHWVQQERPDEVNRILLAFLREVQQH
ncbi:putative hydrolase or acyltransferase of alpha/beta superfamily [Mycolicibacterium rhodesiae NBB3]|uniref:Putative hydrolase or acyltransferase of alpha/beta superfamily n=1 Tax=Mycolicibacterium rhodesiae (strain NBB3) TaxID=710685 RepID=G8RRZ9_MYCRN|nr:alpha/beta hydrolase [Mycolicibacterium rhodesiae]AEV72782.1 putative hydrolase or acyltransferase of alpha/beta superfamily [Mycolicibacterium rhodesiae NBB3]